MPLLFKTFQSLCTLLSKGQPGSMVLALTCLLGVSPTYQVPVTLIFSSFPHQRLLQLLFFLSGNIFFSSSTAWISDQTCPPQGSLPHNSILFLLDSDTTITISLSSCITISGTYAYLSVDLIVARTTLSRCEYMEGAYFCVLE